MEYAVRMDTICKSFSGVKVLDNVDFKLEMGAIHAIVGENGAGKSTLTKILSGAYTKDSGLIYINDKLVEITNPSDAKRNGIQCIYQELSLAPNLSIADNIFLGQELTKNGFVKQKQINKEAQKMMDDLNVRIDVRKEVSRAGIGEQFFTEICRCMVGNAKIVIMDEPTSAMTPSEYNHFLITIKLLRQKGISIIYISHRLDEIFEICDYVTVLRDGKVVSSSSTKEITLHDMIKDMIGKEITGHLKRIESRDFSNAKVLLNLDNISTHKLKNVSLTLREGEVVGVTGLLGAGKTELSNALFGIDKLTGGKIYIDGREVEFNHPNDSIKAGLALVPEDRKGKGLFQEFTVKSNISVTNLGVLEKAKLFVDKRKENQFAKDMVANFGVKCTSTGQFVRFLSGGNQQKVVLAKWIAKQPEILLLDEPTRGIDVGSKEEIYEMIKRLASQGMGVLLLSSEIPEVIALSNRIVVLHAGEVKGELSGEKATQKDILLVATGELIHE